MFISKKRKEGNAVVYNFNTKRRFITVGFIILGLALIKFGTRFPTYIYPLK